MFSAELIMFLVADREREIAASARRRSLMGRDERVTRPHRPWSGRPGGRRSR